MTPDQSARQRYEHKIGLDLETSLGAIREQLDYTTIDDINDIIYETLKKYNFPKGVLTQLEKLLHDYYVFKHNGKIQEIFGISMTPKEHLLYKALLEKGE